VSARHVTKRATRSVIALSLLCPHEPGSLAR
jgi:hypothetical protein